MKKLTIGLIGNPNSGKTTLFNQLTGARQRVGNWAGVTVERKEGQFATTDHQVTLVDLPGTYSLTTISSQTSSRRTDRLPLHPERRRRPVDKRCGRLQSGAQPLFDAATAGAGYSLYCRAQHAGYRRKTAGSY